MSGEEKDSQGSQYGRKKARTEEPAPSESAAGTVFNQGLMHQPPSASAAAAGGECVDENSVVKAASEIFLFFTSEETEIVKQRNALYGALRTAGLFTAGVGLEAIHQQLTGRGLLLDTLPMTAASLSTLCGNYAFKTLAEMSGKPQEVFNALIAMYALNQFPAWLGQAKTHIQTTIEGMNALMQTEANQALIARIESSRGEITEKLKNAFQFITDIVRGSTGVAGYVAYESQKIVGITGYFIKQALVYLLLSRTPYDDELSVASRMSSASVAQSIAASVAQSIAAGSHGSSASNFSSLTGKLSRESRASLEKIHQLDNDEEVTREMIAEMIQGIVNIQEEAAAADEGAPASGEGSRVNTDVNGDQDSQVSGLTQPGSQGFFNDDDDEYDGRIPPGMNPGKGGSKKIKRTKKNKKTKTKKSKKRRKSTRKQRR